jgi:hypothetical protein
MGKPQSHIKNRYKKQLHNMKTKAKNKIKENTSAKNKSETTENYAISMTDVYINQAFYIDVDVWNGLMDRFGWCGGM